MTDVNRNSDNFAVVKACFVVGFYPNVCRIDRKVGNLKTKQEKKVLPHITSVLREKNLKSLKTILTNLPSEWIVFQEKSRVERLTLVRNITVVTPITVALFGGSTKKTNSVAMNDSDSDDDELPFSKFVLDDWISFVLQDDINIMIQQLRIKLNVLFIKTLCNVDMRFGPHSKEAKIIELISSVLETEDQMLGFSCPKDVGKRPILLPSKPSWRSYNEMQPRNDIGHAQKSKSNLHNSQQAQQSQQPQSSQQRHQQQRHQQQRQVTPTTTPLQLANQHRNRKKAVVYRRSNGVSASNNSGNWNRFDAYVSDFKRRSMLKSKIRYFVLHANSKEVILESFRCQKWQYCASSFKLFKSIESVSTISPVRSNGKVSNCMLLLILFQTTIDVDIIVFFLIPKCSFFAIGRLAESENKLIIECLCGDEVPISEAR